MYCHLLNILFMRLLPHMELPKIEALFDKFEEFLFIYFYEQLFHCSGYPRLYIVALILSDSDSKDNDFFDLFVDFTLWNLGDIEFGRGHFGR